jgi:hypothetical protein
MPETPETPATLGMMDHARAITDYFEQQQLHPIDALNALIHATGIAFAVARDLGADPEELAEEIMANVDAALHLYAGIDYEECEDCAECEEESPIFVPVKQTKIVLPH